jgi:hypothetical protein
VLEDTQLCSIPDCGEKNYAKSWCSRHYQKNRKYGDPLADRSRTAVTGFCAVDGCDKSISRTIYCMMHYCRLLRTGELGHASPRGHIERVEENFWAKVDKSDDESCWIWTGGRTDSGYGKMKVVGDEQRAHRVSYQLHHKEELPTYVPIHHTCSNKLCVNPHHLQATTQQENTAEMLERNYYLSLIAELEEKLKNCTCHVQSDN